MRSGSRWASPWWDAALAGGVVLATAALANGYGVGVDAAVDDWVAARQADLARAAAYGLNFLGQGGPLTYLSLGLAVWLGVRTRSVRPVVPVVFVLAALMLTVGPLKLWSDRPFPREAAAARPELFFQQVEFHAAFPSGHTANAVAWVGLLTVLVGRLRAAYGRAEPPARWVAAVRVAAPAVVVVTTVYLRFHWLSDALVGVAIGLLIDRLRARVTWDSVPLPGVAPRSVGVGGR